MKLSINVLVEDFEAAKKVLEALEGIEGVETEEVEETPKKKATKKTRTRKKPEAEEDDMGLGMDDEEESEEETEYSKDDVIKAFKSYVKKFGDVKKGKAAAGKLLKKFKASHIDDIDESDYATVIEACK